MHVSVWQLQHVVFSQGCTWITCGHLDRTLKQAVSHAVRPQTRCRSTIKRPSYLVKQSPHQVDIWKRVGCGASDCKYTTALPVYPASFRCSVQQRALETALPKMNGSTEGNNGNASLAACAAVESPWSYNYMAAMTVVSSVMGLGGVFGNAMVVLLVSTQRRLRHDPPNILIANVAMIELVYFLLSHPITMWNIIAGGTWESDDFLCQMQGFLVTMLVPCCWVAHALMSGEKYFTIATPFKNFFTVKTSYILIVISWIVCTIFAALPLMGISRYAVSANRLICFGVLHDFRDPVFIYFNVLMIGGWLATAWCYGGMFKVVKRLRLSATARKASVELPGGVMMACDDEGEKVGGGSGPVRKRSRSGSVVSQLADTLQMAVTLFISVIFYTVAFVLTAIAEIILAVYYPVHRPKCEIQGSPSFIMGTVHFLLVSFILVINPFVYALRSRKMRKYLGKIRLFCLSLLSLEVQGQQENKT